MIFRIIGKGGLFNVILDLSEEGNYKGYYDDKPSSDSQYLGLISEIQYDFQGGYFLALGSIKNMFLRNTIINKLTANNLLRSNLISPKSYISKSANLGLGNIICPFVNLGVNVQVGFSNIIYSNTTIEHDSIIGTNVNIAPGVTISGKVTVGDNVFIGAGATIKDGITIGDNTVIGAGSVVLEDLQEDSLYYGYPAKYIGKNNIYLKA
jgi:sugar O-acyltransferase (sialic acid O-acetyltransferase NeuD family)